MTTAEKLFHLKKIAKESQILFVEDSTNTRIGTYDILSSFFSNITTANDGEAGLDIYRYQREKRDKYDIVITDFMMPKMNGLEMLQKIKSLNKNQKTVMISAINDEETIAKSKEIGVNYYIIKPIELANIITIFIDLLEN